MNNPKATLGLRTIGALGALIISGALSAPGGVVAAVGPALPPPTPALPTLAPPSALPIVTPPPPRPTASLPIPTLSLVPIPTLPTLAPPSALPIVTPPPPRPTASLPIPTLSRVPIPTLPTVGLPPVKTAPVRVASPNPTAAPITPPAPSVPGPVPFASLPLPSGSGSPLAPAVISPPSTPSPTPHSSPKVILANGLVDAASAGGTGSGLIVSEVTPERPLAIAIARSSGTAGQFAWLVPGLVLGLPGALLLAIVGAQAFGAAAFLGLTRRTLGGLGVVHRAPPTR